MNNNRRSNKIIFITISFLFCALVILIIGKNIRSYNDIKSINNEINSAKSSKEFEIWVIDGGLAYVLDEVIETYRNKYPDTRFIVKSFDSSIYNDTILSAAATNSLPNMFYTWGDTELKELVKLGIVEDITLVTESRHVKGNMVEGALNGYTLDNKVYGMPVFGWNLVLYCNKELFEKIQSEYPSNYEELITVVNKFRKYGIPALTISGQEAWTQSFYYMAFALEGGSVEDNIKVTEDFRFFSAPQFVDAAKKIENISKLDMWINDYKHISAAESVGEFTYGNCAMLLNGSWVSGDIDSNKYNLCSEDVDVVRFPGVSDQGVAGYSDGFVLSKDNIKDNNNELMYIEMMQDISKCAVIEKGMGIPVYKDQSLEETEFETLKKCEDIFPKRKRHSAYDKLLPAELKEGYNEALIKLVDGDISADEFVEILSKYETKR